MLIFNISGAFCTLAIFVLVGLLKSAFPALPGVALSFSACLLVILVGWVAEWLDTKPRAFFIPIWAIGVMMFLVNTYQYAGMFAAFALGVLATAGFFAYRYLRQHVKNMRVRGRSVEDRQPITPTHPDR